MAPFESTDHGFINSTDDIEEGTTNQFFTQARAQASFSITNTTSPTYNGVTYLFGGLNLTNGTITYIPPPPIDLSPYATLASPALTGTPTVGGTAIKVNVGDGALTEKNFTTELKNKLDGIADNADVTPTWVPASNPNYLTSAQAPLETPVVATPSGTGNLTLTSNAGLNTLLTFTPPLIPVVKSKVYGTTYLDSNDIPYNTASAYQTLASGTWAAFGTPSHTTLFPANVTTAGYLVKFPRAGTYNVSVSCQTLGNYPGNATRVLRVQTTTPPSASWVDAKTHQHNEGFGVANDFVYTYTNTINVVIEVTQPDTTLRALIYMSSAGRIDGDILNNGLQQKPTSISVFNVD